MQGNQMVSGFLHAIKKMDSTYIEGVALSEWRKGIKPEETEPWAQDRLVVVEGERVRMATQLPRALTTLIAKWLKAANLLNTKFWEERKREESRKREAVPSGPDFGDRVGVIKECRAARIRRRGMNRFLSRFACGDEFTDCPPTEADGSSILIVSTFIFGERDKIIKECQMSMTQYLTSSLAAHNN